MLDDEAVSEVMVNEPGMVYVERAGRMTALDAPALHVEALPTFITRDNPTVAPRRYDVKPLPSDLREMALVYAVVEALREAVARSDPACRKDAAAAAWHAEPIVRFLCSTFGDGIVGVAVNEDGLIVTTAELSGDNWVDASIAVGPEGRSPAGSVPTRRIWRPQRGTRSRSSGR